MEVPEAVGATTANEDKIIYKDSTYELVSKVAYLIGVPRGIFENEHEAPKLEVYEKLERLELLLGRLFVCIKEYPENLSQADRLLDYYLPSVLKLIRVYEDMEKQPIQSVHIIKTRMEIAESLDTVNQALEAMYDDIFQDVAMDISSDIKVLETMLAKDGWGEQEMHSQTEGGNIWI